jgi:hypothetical protein
MGELLIIHGGLFVPLSARLRKAQETEKLDGVNTRPATMDEKKGRRYGDEDDLWVAEIWQKECSRPFAAFGGVKKREVDKAIAQAKNNNRDPDALPIVKDPAQHAEKRAIARGLRMGFHLPLPSAEDVGSEETDRDAVTVRVINEETGEIIEGESREVKKRASTIKNEAPKKEKPTDTMRHPQTPEIPGEEVQKGIGCETCHFLGAVFTNPEDGWIPCPDCYTGKPDESTALSAADTNPNQQVSTDQTPEWVAENPPHTVQELFTWVASHGKQYTRTWIYKSFSYTEEELPHRIEDCYREILQMTGWEPRS